MPGQYDPQDYWNQGSSGYGEMPGSQSNYNSYGSMNPYPNNTVPWANASTYVPWGTNAPGDRTLYGSRSGVNWYGYDAEGQNQWGWGGEKKPGKEEAPYLGSGGSMGWWDFKGGRKRSSPNFYAPSYQGEMFTPAEGFPRYYNQSPEGANATQQDLYGGYNQGMGSTQSMNNALTGGSYDYNYGAPFGSTGVVGQGGGSLDPYGMSNYVGQQVNQYGY